MADLKKKIYENICCFVVLLLVMLLVYLFASLTFAKSSPLLDFEPKAGDGNILVWLKTNNKEDVAQWVDKSDDFIKSLVVSRHTNRVHCDFSDLPSTGKFCVLNVDNWPACTSKTGYGYAVGSPCVFLELNPESDWLPDYFETPAALPKAMPDFLQAHIQALHANHLRQVWVSCVGKDEADRANMGPIRYVPDHGFPSFYYPAKESVPGYAKPVVAIQFEKPKPGVTINVECRAWAKNIPKGSQAVNFQIHVDP